MLPIRDSIPTVHRPWGVYSIILLNALVFLGQQSLSPREQILVVRALGLVPGYVMHGASPLADRLLPMFSYMFLHGGWMHFLMNMWALWIFADNIEDVMGTWRFLTFYVLCGLLAGAGHMLFNATSPVPVVGASGAIAGVMGAYLLLYPHGTVVAMLPIFFIP